MGMKTPERMVIARNFISPSLIDSISTSNMTFAAGGGKDNLEYEDPWLVMSTASITGAPQIEIVFVGSHTFNVFGFVNHYGLNGSVFTLASHDGGGWNDIGTFGVHSDDPQSDVLVYFDDVTEDDGGQSRLRVTWNSDPGIENLQIGTLFWGQGIEPTQNPDAGVTVKISDVPVLVEEAAGGARHTIFGADKEGLSEQLVFSRLPWDDLNKIRQLPRQHMIGVLPMEQGPAGIGAFGMPHFFGTIRSIKASPQTGESTIDYRYDALVDMIGAV